MSKRGRSSSKRCSLSLSTRWFWVAQLDDNLTEEYDWGWLFVFVPTESDRHGQFFRRAKYDIDRVTGNMTPVGKKGVPEALRDLMRWRPHQEDAG